MVAKLQGLDDVLKNLNKEIKNIEGNTLKGLIRAAIVIRRDMEVTAPRIPIDLGNLRASFYTIARNGTTGSEAPGEFKGSDSGKLGSGHSESVAKGYAELERYTNGPSIMMGFSTSYAWYVHENMMANFAKPGRRAGAGPKFFEAALKRNKEKILSIIKEEATIE